MAAKLFVRGRKRYCASALLIHADPFSGLVLTSTHRWRSQRAYPRIRRKRNTNRAEGRAAYNRRAVVITLCNHDPAASSIVLIPRVALSYPLGQCLTRVKSACTPLFSRTSSSDISLVVETPIIPSRSERCTTAKHQISNFPFAVRSVSYRAR